MSLFTDIVTGYWAGLNEKELHRMKLLQEAIISRRIKLPDTKFIMVRINNKWNEVDVLEYLVNRTEGKLYFTNNKIGFLNDQDAMMFSLRFR